MLCKFDKLKLVYMVPPKGVQIGGLKHRNNKNKMKIDPIECHFRVYMEFMVNTDSIKIVETNLWDNMTVESLAPVMDLITPNLAFNGYFINFK